MYSTVYAKVNMTGRVWSGPSGPHGAVIDVGFFLLLFLLLLLPPSLPPSLRNYENCQTWKGSSLFPGKQSSFATQVRKHQSEVKRKELKSCPSHDNVCPFLKTFSKLFCPPCMDLEVLSTPLRHNSNKKERERKKLVSGCWGVVTNKQADNPSSSLSGVCVCH